MFVILLQKLRFALKIAQISIVLRRHGIVTNSYKYDLLAPPSIWITVKKKRE